MSKRLTRQQIYELVWTEPTRTVAARFGVSDVALAKTCRKADIPIPPRGYWARKEVGQKVLRTALPLRFPGAADEYEIGSNKPYWQQISDQEMLDMPVPPPPEFPETIEALTQRVEKLVGKVSAQKDFSRAFGDVSRLLAHDEERRKSQWSFEKPKYDSGIERRRLLILNSIFLAIHALGCKSSMSVSKYDVDNLDRRGISVTCGAQHVHFTLEPPVLRGRYDRPDLSATSLTLTFGTPGHPNSSAPVWKDDGADKIENRLRDIVMALLVMAEKQHREGAIRYREWIIERKATIQQEAEKTKAEKLRRERETRECIEKQRIDDLLRQASDLQKADAIRSYVRSMLDRPDAPLGIQEKLADWAKWALGQADRIDPSKSEKFLSTMEGVPPS